MKPHYPILDGLRGVAAILVVIFHLFEAYYPTLVGHPIRHGYLAVDFFFLLSGFVVGYAYDDRWERMSVWEFFRIRLIRLHPLVILGVWLGAIGFWFDPYTNGQEQLSLLKLLGVTLISFTLLPSPDIRGWDETHSLDGPCWSLLQEYIANVLYALFVRKMGKVALWGLVLVCGTILTAVAVWRGDLATGWGYKTFWIGMVRMLFPFFAGLLLFRMGKQIRIPAPFLVCSLLLTVLLWLPATPYNGWYEAACIILAFPCIVAAGAGSPLEGYWTKVCSFFGAISYPLYITHYPLVYIYTAWVFKDKPTPAQIVPVACGVFVASMLIAYVSLKWYDEPLRAWLKKKVRSRQMSEIQ